MTSQLQDEVIGHVTREIATLKELNTELLAACKATLACIGPYFDTYQQLKDAITKAEGS